MKIVLFILVVTGIAICGCAGGPSGISGQTKPSFDGFTPGEYPTDVVSQYDTKVVQPIYNDDGSITVMTIGNIRIKISPMNSIRSKGENVPDRSPEEFDRLIKQSEAVLAATPQDYEACFTLASLYVDRNKKGDADMAIKYSDQALAIRKDDADALYIRGIAYNNKGDSPSRDRAINDLESVLKLNLQSMKSVYYLLGKIYSRNGNIDKAITAFEKVKTIDPDFVDVDDVLEDLYKIKE